MTNETMRSRDPGGVRRRRVAIACQGGGSHTAFTAGALQRLMSDLPDDVDVVALSGTSGGAICATLAWEGFVRSDLGTAAERLQTFWSEMAASDPWDQLLNQSLVGLMSLRDLMVLPEVSPYHMPTWGEDRFREMLRAKFNFEELRQLARIPGAAALHVGAVEVLSGHFEVFTGHDLSAEALLASAAIPELFRAVEVPGRGMYWDGLFSQNPPIHNLVAHDIDELWLLQINSSTCARIPTETHEILDRRNELSGNLAMVQELRFIEVINRAIAQGALSSERYRPIAIHRVALDQELGYRSKLDRRPELLAQLKSYGQTKARIFLKERRDARREQARDESPAAALV
jgi:NTE family protein